MKALRENSAQLGISANFGEILDKEFCVKVIGTVPLFVLFPNGHRLARHADEQFDLEDLQEDVLLCPSRKSKPSYYERLNEVCTLAGFVPHSIREVDGADTVAGMVAVGYGVAIVPESAAQSSPPGCRAKRLRMPVSMPPYQLRMLWRRDSNSPALDKFLASSSIRAATSSN